MGIKKYGEGLYDLKHTTSSVKHGGGEMILLFGTPISNGYLGELNKGLDGGNMKIKKEKHSPDKSLSLFFSKWFGLMGMQANGTQMLINRRLMVSVS